MKKWSIHLETAKEFFTIEQEDNKEFIKLMKLKLKYAKEIKMFQYDNRIEIDCVIAEREKETITIKSTNLDLSFSLIRNIIEENLF